MASAKIEIVGPTEYDLICRLYNEIFRPGQDVDWFQNRLRNYHQILMLVAMLEERPVGFSIGYELRPSTYYSWLYGVLPDARRLGIASQLMEAEHAWARDQGYELLRFECYNQHRAMLILAIHQDYDVVGIRYDQRAHGNLVIFEKNLRDEDEM